MIILQTNDLNKCPLDDLRFTKFVGITVSLVPASIAGPLEPLAPLMDAGYIVVLYSLPLDGRKTAF